MAFAATKHTVKSGESLWGIANQYHISVSTLESANHLSTTTIQPGEVLRIPEKSSSSSAELTSLKPVTKPTTVQVTVKSGDTVYGIARRYGVSMDSVLSANHLSSHSILHIGERLVVSTGTSSSASGRSESSLASLSTAVLGQKIVDLAEQFEGVRYHWGGESPSGFDCSGLVQFVLGHFHIHVPRTSYEQYKVGTPVSEHNLQVGDLVFFSTDTAGASHVGIYAGNGKFINAEDRGVRLDSLRNSYWAKRYIGARRVL